MMQLNTNIPYLCLTLLLMAKVELCCHGWSSSFTRTGLVSRTSSCPRAKTFLTVTPFQCRTHQGCCCSRLNHDDDTPTASLNRAQVYRLSFQGDDDHGDHGGDGSMLKELFAASMALHNTNNGEKQMTLRQQEEKYTRLNDMERRIAQETWNWCSEFVVRYNLCPWAAASVANGERCMQIFLVEACDDEDDQELRFERAVLLVSQLFYLHLSSTETNTPAWTMDPTKAIAFVVQCPMASTHDDGDNSIEDMDAGSLTVWDFDSFNDWYLAAEEDMLNDSASLTVLPFELQVASGSCENDRPEFLGDAVTWAPFHPRWRYARHGDYDDLDDDGSPVDLEKQSPYPMVSIVSSQVIEDAGPSVTQQIALENERILSRKTMEEWQRLYKQAVFQNET
ncbi:hypothetical protein ACA910_012627 [Epithemia clementina (nom. ined.)]